MAKYDRMAKLRLVAPFDENLDLDIPRESLDREDAHGGVMPAARTRRSMALVGWPSIPVAGYRHSGGRRLSKELTHPP
jgi:hypothetical protein